MSLLYSTLKAKLEQQKLQKQQADQQNAVLKQEKISTQDASIMQDQPATHDQLATSNLPLPAKKHSHFPKSSSRRQTQKSYTLAECEEWQQNKIKKSQNSTSISICSKKPRRLKKQERIMHINDRNLRFNLKADAFYSKVVADKNDE